MAEQEYSQQKSVSRSGGGDKINYSLQEDSMISSVFSKWNHMEELNPKTELDTICTNNPPKEFASFFFVL